MLGKAFDLSVIFRAVDKLSVPMDKMRKKFDVFAEKAKKVGQGMSNVGRKMTMSLTLPIVALGVAAIKVASDLHEAIDKVEVAFGDSAEGVKQWSKTTLKSFGIAQVTALDMAALYGDMGTSMDIPRERAAEMSKSLVGLSGDLASFKNMRIGQAQTALAAIYTGETESLKKLGYVMTEANLKMFAMSQGITKNITDMTQAEKVQLRYAFIMKKTANAHGNYAKTGGAAAGQMRLFTESLKELAASFGKIMLPLFTKVITKVNKIIKWFEGLSEGTKKFILVVLAIVAVIGPLLMVIGTLIVAISSVATAMVALDITLLPIILIILAIAAAILILIVVIKNWSKIVKFLGKVWKGVVDIFKKVVRYIETMPRAILILVAVFLPFIMLPLMIVRHWRKLLDFFSSLVGGIKKRVSSFKAWFKEIWLPISDWMKEMWTGILDFFSPVIEGFKSAWGGLTDFFMESWEKIGSIIEGIGESKLFKYFFEQKKLETKGMLGKAAGGANSSANVNIKVSADDNSTAVIERVKKTPNSKVSIISDSYLGFSTP